MNRTWIELDREALAHNIRRYQSLLPAGCRIMGVVKADAYGHGARAVAAQLWELGIRHFATATLDEAVQLREAGIQGEILILGYSAPAYFHLLAEHGLTQTATCPDHAAQLEAYCRENGVRLKVHIAVDTGMHRIGFLPEDLDAIAAWLAGSPRYYLQNFVDSGNLIGRGYHGFTAEELRGFAERVRPFFGAVELRGVD